MFKNFFKPVFWLICLIAAAGIAFLLVLRIAGYGRTVEVPLLVGKSVSEATELLNEKGLFLEVQGWGYDAEIPQDHVIRQDVRQGKEVEKGSSVRVFVSEGKAMFTVPYLEGMNIGDVRLTLERAGMEIGKITRVRSYTLEKDIVVAQRPLPGFSGDKRVNLLVSSGFYDISYRCPSFVNMTINEARKIAAVLGLKLMERGAGSAVVFQKPEAGAIVRKGDSVEVTLGRGWGLWF